MDVGATLFATEAAKVKHFSQIVSISFAASTPTLQPYTRNITQAYIESNSELDYEVHIRAPPEIVLPDGYVLKVVKPLYGISESGLHFYITKLAHIAETLKMVRSRADPCVLIQLSKHNLDGIILLQVDGSLSFGINLYLHQE